MQRESGKCSTGVSTKEIWEIRDITGAQGNSFQEPFFLKCWEHLLEVWELILKSKI